MNPLTFIKNIIYRIYRLLSLWKAYSRKQRSLHQLNRLDDYLLNDIGFQRVDIHVVPIQGVRKLEEAQTNELDAARRRRKRLRHAYLRRRRQRVRVGD